MKVAAVGKSGKTTAKLLNSAVRPAKSEGSRKGRIGGEKKREEERVGDEYMALACMYLRGNKISVVWRG